MDNKATKTMINLYNSSSSYIWKRCKEIAERYYEADLWKRGINYIIDFDIIEDKIEIYEGAHGMDLEFKIEDFVDDERLEEAIKNDIKEYIES